MSIYDYNSDFDSDEDDIFDDNSAYYGDDYSTDTRISKAQRKLGNEARIAVRKGHLNKFKRILKSWNPSRGDINHLFEKAVVNGYLDIVKYMYKHYKPTYVDMTTANRDYDTLKVLTTYTLSEALSLAVANGYLQIVKYIFKKIKHSVHDNEDEESAGTPILDTDPLYNAVFFNNMDIAHYLYENGAPISEESLYEGSEEGNMQISNYIKRRELEKNIPREITHRRDTLGQEHAHLDNIFSAYDLPEDLQMELRDYL